MLFTTHKVLLVAAKYLSMCTSMYVHNPTHNKTDNNTHCLSFINSHKRLVLVARTPFLDYCTFIVHVILKNWKGVKHTIRVTTQIQ